MAKTNKKKPTAGIPKADSSAQMTISSPLFPFSGFKFQALLILIVGFAFYWNTVHNEFALDDGIVIIKNEYVQKGFKGIDSVMRTDAYSSFYRQMNAKDQLSGGRYRPLSLVTFAIEEGLFGVKKGDSVSWKMTGDTLVTRGKVVHDSYLGRDSVSFINKKQQPDKIELEKSQITEDKEVWHKRHFVSVVFFVCSLIVLLYFLREVVFPLTPDVAFLATLLFTIHPIHTEVIANVKSRDEILSFLFILLTLIFSFRYSENKTKSINLWLALVCFFLALLAKEYAVVLVVLIPVMLYLFSTKRLSASEAIVKILPFAVVLVGYLAIRFSIVVMKANVKNDEVLNNPYLFCKGNEKLATKISTLLMYIKLQLFPHPLSADYSYSQIPYKNFAHWSVWASLFVHGGIFYLGWKWIKERNPLGFAIAFYILFLALVANIAFDIGATMGERLIYHSSLGFCILAAYYIVHFVQKMKSPEQSKKVVLLLVSIPLVVWCGFETIERNADWKNDITLFTKDVETVPNSALANGNAGARYLDMCEFPENKAKRTEYIQKAIGYLSKSVHIHPKYVNSYLNLGLAYYKLHDYENARKSWDVAKHYYPNNPYLKVFYPMLNRTSVAGVAGGYLEQAIQLGQNQKFDESLALMNKALALEPNNAEIWYNLGGLYFTMKQYDNAKTAWKKTLELNPNHAEAAKGLAALTPAVKQ